MFHSCCLCNQKVNISYPHVFPGHSFHLYVAASYGSTSLKGFGLRRKTANICQHWTHGCRRNQVPMQRCPTRNDMNLCFTLILFFQTSELYAKHCETNDMFVFSGLLWLWIVEGFNMSYGNLLIEALQLFKHKSLFNSWMSRLCYSIIELWGFIMFYMCLVLLWKYKSGRLRIKDAAGVKTSIPISNRPSGHII